MGAFDKGIFLIGIAFLLCCAQARAQNTSVHPASNRIDLQSPLRQTQVLQFVFGTTRDRAPDSSSRFGLPLVGRPADDHGSNLLTLHENKTSFLTESRIPIAQIGGTRLELNVFMLNFHAGNLTRGAQGALDPIRSGRLLRTPDLYGIGLRIPLGRNSRFEGGTNLCHDLLRIKHPN
jgi:hypothetical protein